jgi:hypothetical protein
MLSTKMHSWMTRKLSTGLGGIAVVLTICSISGCENMTYYYLSGIGSSKLKPTADTSLVNIVLEDAPDIVSDRQELLVCRKEDDHGSGGEFKGQEILKIYSGIARGNLRVGTYRILRKSSYRGSGWGWEDGEEAKEVKEMMHMLSADILILGFSRAALVNTDADVKVDFPEGSEFDKKERSENNRGTEIGTCTSITSAITRYERAEGIVKITKSTWTPYTTRLEFRVTESDLGKEINIGVVNLSQGTGKGERIRRLD